MHNRPAARREVAGPKRARRAVIEVVKDLTIAIGAIANAVLAATMKTPIEANPIEVRHIKAEAIDIVITMARRRIMHGEGIRAAGMIAAARKIVVAKVLRERLDPQIVAVRWIGLCEGHEVDLTPETHRPSHVADDLVRVPALIVERDQRLRR